MKYSNLRVCTSKLPDWKRSYWLILDGKWPIQTKTGQYRRFLTEKAARTALAKLAAQRT